MHAAFGKTSFLFYLNYTETTFCAHKKGLAKEKDGIGTERDSHKREREKNFKHNGCCQSF